MLRPSVGDDVIYDVAVHAGYRSALWTICEDDLHGTEWRLVRVWKPGIQSSLLKRQPGPLRNQTRMHWAGFGSTRQGFDWARLDRPEPTLGHKECRASERCPLYDSFLPSLLSCTSTITRRDLLASRIAAMKTIPTLVLTQRA